MSKTRMWSVAVCVSLTAAMLSAGMCQPPGGGGDKPKQPGPPNPAWPRMQRALSRFPEIRMAFGLKPALFRVFEFTDDQINQFLQAYDAINPDATDQALRQKERDPNLTPEDRQKLRTERETQMKTMTENLRTKMEEIMTPDQKSLMKRVLEAARAAEKAFNECLDKSLTEQEKQRLEPPAPRPPQPGAG